MARCAREKDTFGVFYVHQVSNPEGVLFRNDDDRRYFLEVLKKAQQKFEFKLYGYCLLSSNAYHLILDVNGGDLSNIMKSINIRYAIYANSDHPLFKDRYKSQLLASVEDIQKKIQEVHKREYSQFNSYCHYDESNPINLEWISPLDRHENRNCGCINCIETLTQAREYINKVAEENGITTSDLFKDKAYRNDMIKDIRRKSTLSLKDIGTLFGGLSESCISKILSR